MLFGKTCGIAFGCRWVLKLIFMKKKDVFLMFLFLVLIFSCGRKYETYLGKMGSKNQKFPFSDFDTVETYSFNRDTIGNRLKYLKQDSLYEKYYKTKKWEVGERELVDKINRELEEVDTSILNRSTLEFAPSSSFVNTLSKKDFKELKIILSDQRDTFFEYSSCWPTYRDALVFKKKEKIVGWIDLCFDCNIISFYPNSPAYVNGNSWRKLRTYFIRLGHPLRK